MQKSDIYRDDDGVFHFVVDNARDIVLNAIDYRSASIEASEILDGIEHVRFDVESGGIITIIN